MQTLQPAPTLKDLRDRIDEAIAIAGKNDTWNGYDDEAIYIYHPNDRRLKWANRTGHSSKNSSDACR